jgi:hypothetical protein
VLIARGRDAADVPFLRSFGEHHLLRLEVITESITEQTQEQNAALIGAQPTDSINEPSVEPAEANGITEANGAAGSDLESSCLVV